MLKGLKISGMNRTNSADNTFLCPVEQIGAISFGSIMSYGLWYKESLRSINIFYFLRCSLCYGLKITFPIQGWCEDQVEQSKASVLG